MRKFNSDVRHDDGKFMPYRWGVPVSALRHVVLSYENSHHAVFEPTWPEQALSLEMAVASYKKANLKEFLHSFLCFRKNFEKKGAIFFGSMCSSWIHLPRTNRGQKI
jgi:hypothetical protein